MKIFRMKIHCEIFKWHKKYYFKKIFQESPTAFKSIILTKRIMLCVIEKFEQCLQHIFILHSLQPNENNGENFAFKLFRNNFKEH